MDWGALFKSPSDKGFTDSPLFFGAFSPALVHCPPSGLPAGTRGWSGLYLRPSARSASSNFRSASMMRTRW